MSNFHAPFGAPDPRPSRQPVPRSITEACAFRVTFGKYAGLTVREIADKDPSYLGWASREIKQEAPRVAAALVLRAVEAGLRLDDDDDDDEPAPRPPVPRTLRAARAFESDWPTFAGVPFGTLERDEPAALDWVVANYPDGAEGAAARLIIAARGSDEPDDAPPDDDDPSAALARVWAELENAPPGPPDPRTLAEALAYPAWFDADGEPVPFGLIAAKYPGELPRLATNSIEGIATAARIILSLMGSEGAPTSGPVVLDDEAVINPAGL